MKKTIRATIPTTSAPERPIIRQGRELLLAQRLVTVDDGFPVAKMSVEETEDVREALSTLYDRIAARVPDLRKQNDIQALELAVERLERIGRLRWDLRMLITALRAAEYGEVIP